jgi:hypothetical protein
MDFRVELIKPTLLLQTSSPMKLTLLMSVLCNVLIICNSTVNCNFPHVLCHLQMVVRLNPSRVQFLLFPVVNVLQIVIIVILLCKNVLLKYRFSLR